MSLYELRSDAATIAPRPAAPRAVPAGAERAAGGGTPWRTLVIVGVLAALGLVLVDGVAIVNGDGVWHLIWGRELVEGTLSSFNTGPTPHPSLLAVAAATSLLGDDASYLITFALFGPIAFGLLAAATYEVARRLSSPVAGVIAVVLIATSSGVVSVASSARYDIVFGALVLTAVALEMDRPRRGVAPLACLAAAGLVRPEAWVLAGAYWLWLAPPLSWPQRLRLAALAAAGPVLWSLMDTAVMGDPLYSLHATEQGSDVLYRQFTPSENLEVAARNLIWYLGALPLVLVPPALVLLRRDHSRVALPLLAVAAITLAIFLLLIAQGLASSERYLLVPVCIFAILAATAVDGAGVRTRHRVMLGVPLAVLLVLQVVGQRDIYGTLGDRAETVVRWSDNARALVAEPGVRTALLRCDSVALPSGSMRHFFSFHSGRPPETFTSDGRGHTDPDIYIAPANPQTAESVLTRTRFDADASFRMPPGLQRGPANRDWALYAAPDSACARGLLR
jgi:hypothetical protein